MAAMCSAQIASESFENSSAFTITGGSYVSGNSTASDRPATSPEAVAGTYAYGGTNTTVTMISPVYNTSCYTGISLSLRVAAFSIASSTNGMDGTDKVQIFLSTNGGTSYTQYLEVDGNSNAYWAYSATGTATTAYPSAATFAPAGGGSRTTDGYSTMTITSLPAISNLVVKIVMINNSTGELWTVDDFKITGTAGACNSITTGAVSAPTFSVDCFSGQAGSVTFTSSGTFNSGNVYAAQLSGPTGSFASPTTIGTTTSTANSGTISFTIPANTTAGTAYQIQVVSSNPAVTGSASSTFTITNSCVPLCPTLTGAILNSCDNGVAGCNEGDGEIFFLNTGTYSVSVASLPAHVINYYGGTTSFTTSVPDAYTGTFSANASMTSTLNGMTGCTNSFIDGATAGTIPAGATVMMVPGTFCPTNYDFSAICSSFSPVYVLYFGTTLWNSTGNLANHQTPSPKPKYITVDFSAACGGCAMEYYTYDADTEKTNNGAGVAYPSSISTSSTTPISPGQYTNATCTLPVVLAVNVLSFVANALGRKSVELKFRTANEENLKLFNIYKSTDGFTYSFATTVAPRNTLEMQEYSAVDESETDIDKRVYYKLEEEDLNGTKRIVSFCVYDPLNASDITIFQDHDEVRILSPVAITRVTFYAAGGAEIFSSAPTAELMQLSIDSRAFPAGFYLITVTDITGKTTIKKVVR